MTDDRQSAQQNFCNSEQILASTSVYWSLIYVPIGFLHQMCLNHPHCLLEAKMSGVVHGTEGMGWGMFGHFCTGSIALIVGYLISSELLILALQAAVLIASTYSAWNQSYSTNIPGVARLSDPPAKPVFNSKIQEAVSHQRAIGRAGVYWAKAKSKRRVLRRFLKVATEVAEWTDSIFVPKTRGARLKCSCTCIGLDPRNQGIPLI